MNRRLSVIVATALSIVASGCQTEAPSAPMVVAPNLAASSGGVETNVSFPIHLDVFVPCANGGAGEDISMDGNLHDIFNILFDGHGGIHVKTHDQPQGLTGVGLVTGDKYQGTGVTQEEFNLLTGVTDTFVNNFRMIGQGPGNNFLVHENAHITINANGVVTVSHDNLSVECK